jgi:hypothetical protein
MAYSSARVELARKSVASTIDLIEYEAGPLGVGTSILGTILPLLLDLPPALTE